MKKKSKRRSIYQAAAARRKRSLRKPGERGKLGADSFVRVKRIAKKKVDVSGSSSRGAGFGFHFKTAENEDLHDAARRALGVDTRAVKSIKIGRRARKDLGDLKPLTQSIDKRGLLHPIVITPKNVLIAGERRLKAWQQSVYRYQQIPVRVIDIDSIVAGEWDENDPAIRKNFTPSEAVAIKRMLEPKLKAEAKQRQRDHGKTTRGRKAKPIAERGEAAEKAARATGKSRRTLDKAEAILAAHEADPKNKKIAKLVDDMDRTGRVDGPHKRLQIMQRAAAIKAAPPGVPMLGPYAVVAIDFPWPHEPEMSQEDLDARGRSLRPYPAMSIEAGRVFMRDKVRPILEKNSVVYFWTTAFHMRHAFDLLEALGFKKHSTIAVWDKGKLGRGQVLRDRTEFCIIARRGDPVINLVGMDPQPTTLWQGKGWERRENSQKPLAFYQLVEQLTPAPRYAEIFSCSDLGDKWDGHGDQVGKHAPITKQLPLPEPPAAEPVAAAPDPGAAPAPSDDLEGVPDFLRRSAPAAA